MLVLALLHSTLDSLSFYMYVVHIARERATLGQLGLLQRLAQVS